MYAVPLTPHARARVATRRAAAASSGSGSARSTRDSPRAAVRTAGAGGAGLKRARGTATEKAATVVSPANTAVPDGVPDAVPPAVAKAADMPAEAAPTGTACPPVRSLFEDGALETAHVVQQVDLRHGLDAGRRRVGRGIGLTSPAVQRHVGVDQPGFGVLFADVADPDGGEVPAGRLPQPEVGPRSRSCWAAICRTASARSSTCCARPTSRCPRWRPSATGCGGGRGWDISLVGTVADNASCGRYALGARPYRSPGSVCAR